MSDRDYLERTIATVRNHRDADNCWPQWANIFADEIERLWKLESDAMRVVGALIESAGGAIIVPPKVLREDLTVVRERQITTDSEVWTVTRPENAK